MRTAALLLLAALAGCHLLASHEAEPARLDAGPAQLDGAPRYPDAVGPCSAWSAWSCMNSNFPLGCTASCSPRPLLTVTVSCNPLGCSCVTPFRLDPIVCPVRGTYCEETCRAALICCFPGAR